MNTEELKQELQLSCVELEYHEDIKYLSSDYKLSTQYVYPGWFNYASKLNSSNVMYFTPKLYNALLILTKTELGFFLAHINGLAIYLVGVFKDEQDQNFENFMNAMPLCLYYHFIHITLI